MKKQLFFLFTIISFFFTMSCSSDQGNIVPDAPFLNEAETATLSFTVELETDNELTRAPGDEGFGNGNKINNLVYALYTRDSSLDPNGEGEIKPVKIKDAQGIEQDLIRVDFNPGENNVITIQDVEIIKGIEYTLMLWAQYRPEVEQDDDRIYFELGNDGIIRIKFYTDNPFPNNDDHRDVFCAVYKIVQYEDARNLKFTLRRPFAQINIGVKEGILKRGGLIDDKNNLLIESSSITLSGEIANKYNLFKNISEIERDEEGENATLMRKFAANTIPSKAEENSYKYLNIKDRDTNESLDYVWLSMCYILPTGELGNVSEISIDDFRIYDKDDTEIDLLKSHSFSSIPAMRNRRTNIILEAKDFDIVPWFEQQHEKLLPEDFPGLIEQFYKHTNYFDSDYLYNNVELVYKDNIILDDDGNKYIMLEGITYVDPYNILPIHRDYTLYGTGEDCIITKDANSTSYHNTGPVRNLVIQDKNGNFKIFIDEEGYVWTYNNEEKTKTTNYLPPLTGENKSYDITCSTGQVKISQYYH